jgi:hypothetical protein
MPEDKIARICWNTNIWQKPSGPVGKSRNIKAYENLTGYGHEEWLLDTEKTIDGYHYAYLQAIGAHRDKYVGQKFNISLYSINNATKERWWIGEIKNVEVITPEESVKVFKIYKKNKWLQEMLKQLKEVDADIEDFKKISNDIFSTIRFYPSDLQLLDIPRQFSHDDPAITSDYYNLKNKIENPMFLESEFNFTHGHNKGKENTIKVYSSCEKENDLFHNRMQTSIYNQFAELYGKKNVGTEQCTGFGSRIDIVVNTGTAQTPKYMFFELKTSNSARQCIREALSQLLEYSHFPNKNLAEKLIIVSHNKIDKNNINYLKTLRKMFSIPIYYRKFDTDRNLLDENEY